MATSDQIKALTALYIGYFDRAPDPVGLQFWIDQLDNGREFATIAQDFASSEEAVSLYPYLATPDVASPEEFIRDIYLNLFDREPDVEGAAFWATALESGAVAVGDMIDAIIQGAQGDDKVLIDNLTAAAQDWTSEVAGTATFVWSDAAAQSSREILAGVTKDPASVDSAKSETEDYVSSFEPQPFVLNVDVNSVIEPDAGTKLMSFVLTLNMAPTSDVVVSYETLTSGSANRNDDFNALVGEVTFKAGQTRQVVEVQVVGDQMVEGAETVEVVFTGARLAAPVIATGTILDNDNTPIDAVRDAAAASNLVSESALLGSTVGIRAQAVDIDPGSVVTYSLDDDAEGRFVIDPVTGVVTVASALDYEAETSHVIGVRATSSDGTFSVKDFTVSVTNENDNALTAVVDVNSGANEVAENALVGSVVGVTARASDADAGANVSYALEDNAGGRFAIDAATGVVTVALAGGFDFEAAQSHDIIVAAISSDGDVTRETISIAVTDTPDPIQVLTIGTDTLALGRQDNLIVGSDYPATYNSSDLIDGGDGTDTLQLALAAGYGYSTASPTVRNVEALDVSVDDQYGNDVTVDMSRFDTSVQRINLHDIQGSVEIRDQQSVADVSIRDTNSNVTLGYDSQVNGNTGGQTLSVTVDEFGTGASNTKLTVNDVDNIVIEVADGQNESSNFELATGDRPVGVIYVSGGLDDQDVDIRTTLHNVETFSSEGFDGDLNVESSTEILGYVYTFDGDDTLTLAGSDDFDDIEDGGYVYMGAGNDRINADNIHGWVEMGAGNDTLDVDLVGDAGYVDMGAGNNLFEGGVITGNGRLKAGAGDDALRADAIFLQASVDLGDGENVVELDLDLAYQTQVRLGAGNDVFSARRIIDAAQLDMGDGDNDVTAEEILGNAKVTLGDGTNSVHADKIGSISNYAAEVEITLGDGNDNEVTVGDGDGAVYNAVITFGDGDGQVFRSGSVTSSTITMG
ncbi:cadherin domain-containing protein, partial [Marivita sp.]|uniref:cadherin domain-containing protein n=1 Tax=Marivita sp. TaxID=2003365 RepID=UPI0025C19868